MSTTPSQASDTDLAANSIGPSQPSNTSTALRQSAPSSNLIPLKIHMDVPFSLFGYKPSRQLKIPNDLALLEPGTIQIDDMDKFPQEWRKATIQHLHKLRSGFLNKSVAGIISFVETSWDGRSVRGVTLSDTKGYPGSDYQDIAEFAILSDWIPNEEFPASNGVEFWKEKYFEMVQSRQSCLKQLDNEWSGVVNISVDVMICGTVY